MSRTPALFLLLVLPLLCMSCSSFTWKGRGVGLDDEAVARGIKDVDQLRSEYDSHRYWSFWRRNWDGRVMAMRRDLHHVHRSLDRHLFNYDWNDPYLFH